MDFNLIQGRSVLAGGTTAYTGTLSVDMRGYVTYGIYECKFNATNTGAATLNLNSKGVKNIFNNRGSAVVAGELIANAWYFLLYDGTNFVVLNDTQIDTGWVNLIGSSFSTFTPSAPPQYRRIGKQVHFRGTQTVPLRDAGTLLIPYTAESSYINQKFVVPFQGAGGVTVNTNGSLTFSLGAAVIPYTLDNTYKKEFVVMHRRLNDVADAFPVTYTGTCTVYITTAGVLILGTLKDLEEYNPGSGTGASPLRFINSNVVANDYAIDFRSVDNAGGNDTLHGTTANADLVLDINQQTFQHSVTMDSADESTIGGWNVNLDGLIGYIA